MNLADLRARAREESGILATTIVSDATFNAYINEAYLELARQRPWPWTRATASISTVAGTATYNLPAGVQQVERIAVRTGSSQRVLDQRSASDADAFVRPAAAVTGNGLPVEYVVSDDRLTVTLFPTPSVTETLTVVYQATPAVLTGTASPAFDSQFHQLLAYAAALRALIARGDETERVKTFGSFLTSGLVELERWYQSSRDTAWTVAAGSNRLAWNRHRTGYWGL
jgi:hypothetical protein